MSDRRWETNGIGGGNLEVVDSKSTIVMIKWEVQIPSLLGKRIAVKVLAFFIELSNSCLPI